MKKELKLYPHNQESYKKIKEAFQTERVVGIVHATGTGKSYNALQLALDNIDKKIVYIVPSKSIIEHLKEIIKEEGLDLETDFPNLEFRTYSGFVNMSEKEIKKMKVDLLILDEFHHLGAPVWGARINKIIETHEQMKLFGMTAYTIRDRGTIYERDMADENKEELFSNKIVSVYDILDALIDGVLPKPRYKSAHFHLLEVEQFLEKKLETSKLKKEENDLLERLLKDAKKRIHESKTAEKLVTDHLKPDGKYIYFCPPNGESGVNDIDTIMKETYGWLRKKYPNKKIIFYKTTSEEEREGKKNREAFYNDKTLDGENAKDSLRVMFAINQYNEGVHAPNVDGVILGRGTKSDIVFFEQLGRALAVKGKNQKKYEEYQKMSIEELKKIASEQGIEDIETKTKEEIIDLLLSPIVIDLAGNIEFIKELETNLKDRIREIQAKGNKTKRKIKLTNPSFDIEIENIELFEILKYVRDRLMPPTWDTMYELATYYYKFHDHLNISRTFKTLNGITENENGYALGRWLSTQRLAYQNRNISKEQRTNAFAPLTDDQVKKLESIQMIWDVRENEWYKMYGLAVSYYKHQGHLNIPSKFKTIDGIIESINGYALGRWLSTQRLAYQNRNIPKEKRTKNLTPLTDEQVKKLESIGMIWDVRENEWNKMYGLAVSYYKHQGHLNIPSKFKTIDGVTESINGYALGIWISNQRKAYQNRNIPKEKRTNHFTPLTDEQVKKLEFIGMIWDIRENEWNKMYELATYYYKFHGHLNIPTNFKTLDGITENEKGYPLGSWLSTQRFAYQNRNIPKEKRTNHFTSLTDERVKKLESIGMIWEIRENEWNKMYELATYYYKFHDHLNIPRTFKTLNGITENKDGYALGRWISTQRLAYRNRTIPKEQRINTNAPLTDDQVKKLESIGMIWEIREGKWNKMYELATYYYKFHGHLNIPINFKTLDGITENEKGYPLGIWISNQRKAYQNRSIPKELKKNTLAPLTEEQVQKLESIGMIWELRKQTQEKKELCSQYNLPEEPFKNIPFKELKAKINFLLTNNLPLLEEENKPHELFFMSEANMTLTYGITKKELLTYGNEKGRSR